MQAPRSLHFLKNWEGYSSLSWDTLKRQEHVSLDEIFKKKLSQSEYRVYEMDSPKEVWLGMPAGLFTRLTETI